MYHNPVLLHESVDGLNINPNGVYVDVLDSDVGWYKDEIVNGAIIFGQITYEHFLDHNYTGRFVIVR